MGGQLARPLFCGAPAGFDAAGERVCTVLGHSAAVNWLSFLADQKISRICKKSFFVNPQSGTFARRISTCVDSLSCKFLKFRFLQETLLAARLRPGSSAGSFYLRRARRVSASRGPHNAALSNAPSDYGNTLPPTAGSRSSRSPRRRLREALPGMLS